MKDLRYIKLFEAFESSKINKTLSFLNKSGKDEFLKKLKQVCATIDLPESRLSDELFEYVPYARAIKHNGNAASLIDCPAEGCNKGKVTKKWGRGTRTQDCNTCKGKGKVTPKTALSLIKFWFNKDGEFLSVTGVDGNYRPGNLASTGQSAFSKNLDDYDVVNERIPKTRMHDLLNTGDIVKLTLISRSGWRGNEDIPNIIAYVLRHNNKLWAIQDTHSYSYDYIYRNDYQSIGDRAWQMTNGSIRNIVKLKPKVANVRKKDPLGFNTQLDDRLKVKQMGITDSVKDANFAIILDLNKLGNLEFTKKSKITSDRKENKKDALALMSDEDIKSVNLKRYFDELKKRTKIVGDIEDIAMFSKIVLRLIGGKYSAYNLSYNSHDYLSNTVPSNIASKIFQILRAIKRKQKDGTLDEYLESVEFKQLVQTTNEYYESGLDEMVSKNKAYAEYLTDVKKKIKSNTADADDVAKQTKIISLLDTLSVEINKVISSIPCECLEDIEILLQEVTNIRSMMSGERSGINSLQNFFSSMNPSSWSRGNAYDGLRRANYGNVINGLNHLISIMKRKQSLYKK